MAGNPTGIAAFVEAFGNSFARVNNQRIQQQLAIKHSQDSAIAETLIKSGMEDPTLWDNENFAGPAKKVLGAQNAKAIAEIAKQYAASPMGVLRRGFGAEALARPDVPPEGPVFNPQALDARPEAINAVVAPRISGQTPIETGLGFDSQTGFLQAKTQDLATKPPLNAQGLTPAQQATLDEKRAARGEAQKRFEQDQAGKAEDRNLRKFRAARDTAMGVEVDRQLETPLGDVLPYKARRVVQPDGSIIETPVSVKLEKPSAQMIDKFQGLNTGIRAAAQLKQMLSSDPAEIQQLLIPFAGKKLDEIQAQAGTLTPKQRKFLSLVNELRAQRSFALGGKNLTGTELAVFDGILPTVSESASTFPIIVQHALDTLTEMGVDTENAARQAGIRAPRTLMTPFNKDLIAHVRKRSASLPGMTVVAPPGTVDTSGMPKGQGGQGNVESELDSLDAVLNR